MAGRIGTDRKGCGHCGKSFCQVCNFMNDNEHFHCNVDRREYMIKHVLIIMHQKLCIC